MAIKSNSTSCPRHQWERNANTKDSIKDKTAQMAVENQEDSSLLNLRPKKKSCFWKLYRPYFFGAYSNFFLTSENFSSIFNDFHAFSYIKKSPLTPPPPPPQKKIPYIPAQKNIEMFPETRYLFFFCLNKTNQKSKTNWKWTVTMTIRTNRKGSSSVCEAIRLKEKAVG